MAYTHLLFLLLAVVQTGSAAPLTSTLKDQQGVSLTIYNSNVGLVKDIRLIDLKPGVHELKFMDVAAKIDPTTVHIKSLIDESSLSVLEQNYEYDLLSPQKLLEKFVGQKVQLATINPETKKEEIVEAILLSTQGGNIFQIGDKISHRPSRADPPSQDPGKPHPPADPGLASGEQASEARGWKPPISPPESTGRRIMWLF